MRLLLSATGGIEATEQMARFDHAGVAFVYSNLSDVLEHRSMGRVSDTHWAHSPTLGTRWSYDTTESRVDWRSQIRIQNQTEGELSAVLSRSWFPSEYTGRFLKGDEWSIWSDESIYQVSARYNENSQWSVAAPLFTTGTGQARLRIQDAPSFGLTNLTVIPPIIDVIELPSLIEDNLVHVQMGVVRKMTGYTIEIYNRDTNALAARFSRDFDVFTGQSSGPDNDPELPVGNYAARIRARTLTAIDRETMTYDPSGFTSDSAWSPAVGFRILPAGVSGAGYPVNTSGEQPATPTWDAVDGTRTYDIELEQLTLGPPEPWNTRRFAERKLNDFRVPDVVYPSSFLMRLRAVEVHGSAILRSQWSEQLEVRILPTRTYSTYELENPSEHELGLRSYFNDRQVILTGGGSWDQILDAVTPAAQWIDSPDSDHSETSPDGDALNSVEGMADAGIGSGDATTVPPETVHQLQAAVNQSSLAFGIGDGSDSAESVDSEGAVVNSLRVIPETHEFGTSASASPQTSVEAWNVVPAGSVPLSLFNDAIIDFPVNLPEVVLTPLTVAEIEPDRSQPTGNREDWLHVAGSDGETATSGSSGDRSHVSVDSGRPDLSRPGTDEFQIAGWNDLVWSLLLVDSEVPWARN